jgi:tripartite-type tricarboxylate transporter receptor subunit TctC
VPWPAGGATDLTMRLLAEVAGRQLGQKVLVENRAGAGGTLAMPMLQQAAPDGYTIAQLPQPVFRAPTCSASCCGTRSATPRRSCRSAASPSAWWCRRPAPFKSWTTCSPLPAATRALSMATNGVGTTPHRVLDELFGKRGLSWIHVPYKGTAEQMIAVSSGQVMVGVNSNGFAPFVDSGHAAAAGHLRRAAHPALAAGAHAEGTGPRHRGQSPYGLAGPRGMPAEVVRVLHDAFKAAMHDPAHLAELARYDQDLAYLGPDDYGRAMRERLCLAEVRLQAPPGLDGAHSVRRPWSVRGRCGPSRVHPRHSAQRRHPAPASPGVGLRA